MEEQHLACQVRRIFKNKRPTENEIQQLQKEIEKDKIVADRVELVSEMSCGGSTGTKTVGKQCCNLEDYPRKTPEDHIENPIYQHLIEIMHEGAKGDIPTLHSRDITLVTKHFNEVNEVLKCTPVKDLSELKYVATVSALLVCVKIDVKIDHAINKKEPFWKQRIEKDIAVMSKVLSTIDDWFKG